jgi:hypothetical protein
MHVSKPPSHALSQQWLVHVPPGSTSMPSWQAFDPSQVTVHMLVWHSTDCLPFVPCWHAFAPKQRTVQTAAVPQSTP